MVRKFIYYVSNMVLRKNRGEYYFFRGPICVYILQLSLAASFKHNRNMDFKTWLCKTTQLSISIWVVKYTANSIKNTIRRYNRRRMAL